ncbi:hypothetical protein BC827DRAFT_176305 [Russula dissimulans]|nr:hypothetical protein BC827DRAFT_176305 [Russula dissimulans]
MDGSIFGSDPIYLRLRLRAVVGLGSRIGSLCPSCCIASIFLMVDARKLGCCGDQVLLEPTDRPQQRWIIDHTAGRSRGDAAHLNLCMHPARELSEALVYITTPCYRCLCMYVCIYLQARPHENIDRDHHSSSTDVQRTNIFHIPLSIAIDDFHSRIPRNGSDLWLVWIDTTELTSVKLSFGLVSGYLENRMVQRSRPEESS